MAFAVTGLLEQHFGRLVDYGFTAAMEDELDEIAAGQEHAPPGSTTSTSAATTAPESIARSGGLKKLVGVNLEGIDAREVNSIKLFDDEQGRRSTCGSARTVRTWSAPSRRRRRAAAREPQRLADPGRADAGAGRKAVRHTARGSSAGVDPETGHEIVAKDGRYGPYVTEVLRNRTSPKMAPAKKGKKPTGPKPRTGSLLRSMSLETVTLEDALKLLSLPRVVGVDPNTGEEITAQNGRYGPYLKRGTDSRSLTTEEQMFDITLDEALKIYPAETSCGTACFGTAAARAGHRPGDRQADGDQGRPVRAVRHRR